MEFVRKENTYKKEKIVVENFDIRNFYLDNEAIKGIDDAVDSIADQRESYDRFMTRVKDNKLYYNIKHVKPR